MAECINSSTPLLHVLKAQLLANDSGDVLVPSYDWQEKLGHFWPVPHLKKYHHLMFSNAHPRVVQCYTDSSDKVGESFTVCSDRSVSDKLPTQLYADGLSKTRKDYLFQKIRNFCPDHAKDILCGWRMWLGLKSTTKPCPLPVKNAHVRYTKNKHIYQRPLVKLQHVHFAMNQVTRMLCAMASCAEKIMKAAKCGKL